MISLYIFFFYEYTIYYFINPKNKKNFNLVTLSKKK